MTELTPHTINQDISNQLSESFTRYAFMSLEDRALPDARDGLKPSQRRVFIAMDDLKLSPGGTTKKSAKICGDTSANYHPHGEAIVYPTMYRFVQDWVLRYPLLTGQGNFGSRDGYPPAAMRYTEAKLSPVGQLLLDDLSEDVVTYQPNYNDSLTEPTILPSKIPNLLLNGCTGIAVGWATNMPPHNLKEVVAVVKAYIKNPQLTPENVLKLMPGPDFPTGGKLLGQAGVLDYYKGGRGSVLLEGVYEIKPKKNGGHEIIVTELPYMVAPADFIKEVMEMVKDGTLQGVTDMKDLSSNKVGMQIWMEIGKFGNPNLIINTLLKKTSLRKTFSVNQTVLIDGKVVEHTSVLDLIKTFVTFREEVLTKKFTAERQRNLHRTEIVEGYILASSQLDKAIQLIRNADSPEDAKQLLLTAKIVRTEAQADAVLAMTLRSLTKLESKNLKDELEKLQVRVNWLDSIIGNVDKTRQLIVEEQDELAKKYGDARRTVLEFSSTDIDDEDLIKDEKVIVILSGEGYLRRIPVSDYKIQQRGGKGVKNVKDKEDEDGPIQLFEASTKEHLLFFTTTGQAYRRKVYEIPQSSKSNRGTHVSNLLNLSDGESVTNMIAVGSLKQDGNLLMVTEQGYIKRTKIDEFDTSRKNAGIVGIKLEEEDKVAYVLPTDGNQDIFIVTQLGQCVRYSEDLVSVLGRASRGCSALDLQNDDKIAQVFTLSAKESPNIFVITSVGQGKRSESTEYRKLGSRNVKGYSVMSREALKKNGAVVVGACAVTDTDSLLAITKLGQAIRFNVEDVRQTGRATAGVRVVDLTDVDKVTKLAKLLKVENLEEVETSN